MDALWKAIDNPNLKTLVYTLGVITFVNFLRKTIGVFMHTFVLPGTSLKKYGAGTGAWAVITGASEGIGREYALQLADKGFNILVLARNLTALDTLVKEIESKHSGKVKAKALAADFSRVHDISQWSALRSELESLDIGVLVNNVGRSHAFPSDFVDTTEEEVDSILTININSTLKFTHMILPGMVKRKRGLILFSGSFAGVSTISPMLATYAASKKFLASFAAALGSELSGKGVDVELVNTYFVVSNMSKIRKPTIMIPLPKPYVKAVLAKIGWPCGALYTGRPNVSTPYWSHAYLDYLIHVIGLPAVIGKIVHNMHKDIRARALKKLAREAKQQ